MFWTKLCVGREEYVDKCSAWLLVIWLAKRGAAYSSNFLPHPKFFILEEKGNQWRIVTILCESPFPYVVPGFPELSQVFLVFQVSLRFNTKTFDLEWELVEYIGWKLWWNLEMELHHFGSNAQIKGFYVTRTRLKQKWDVETGKLP